MSSPLTSKFSTAWALALAPLILFVPAVGLAGLGPCTFAHPLVIVIAFLLFIVLELAALPCFVKAARAAGRVVNAMIGMGLAVVLLLLSVALEYYAVTEYWADAQFS
ncbi:MAG TPA: hypothetical protein VMH04_05335 [Candidatus Solibacter sp.]|nr:hypothetical protein [Candidatus Solibacter sp.]